MKAKRKYHVAILSALIMVIASTLLYLIAKGLKICCPFNYLTGLNCPGCGNTRAMLALVKFDFKSVLHFNLLFPLEIIYIVYVYSVVCANYIRHGTFSYHTRAKSIDISFLILILFWSVIRNIINM